MLVRGSRCAFFHFGYHMFARLRLFCVVLLFFVFLHRLPPYSYASACLRALGRKLCLLKYVSVLLMCLNAFLSVYGCFRLLPLVCVCFCVLLLVVDRCLHLALSTFVCVDVFLPPSACRCVLPLAIRPFALGFSSFRPVSRCTCSYLCDSACFCVLIGLLLFLAIFAYFSPFGVLLAVCVRGCWFLLDYLCF
jgi:hypothetical protein